MQIQLHLDGHCIETAAKLAYERMVRRCLKGGLSGAEELIFEKKMKAILFFLKNADFSCLRAAYPDLDGRKKLQVVLSISECGETIKILWGEQTVILSWKPGIQASKQSPVMYCRKG